VFVILTLSGAEGEEPRNFAFAFAVARSLTLYTISEFALAQENSAILR